MSANLITHKIEFSVFGRGYDDDRGNSGSGAKEPDHISYGVNSACFDTTGRYCWVSLSSSGMMIGLRKLDVETMTFVDQGNIPRVNNIYHPVNVDNNWGVCFSDNTTYIFDLTTNEIIYQISDSKFGNTTANISVTLDEESNILRFAYVEKASDNKYRQIFSYDIDNDSWSEVGWWDRACVGFIDVNSAYMHYYPVWFSSYYQAGSLNASGGTDWWVTAGISHKFDNLGGAMWGLVGRGKLFIPSYVDGAWVMGEYDASSAPDFLTPSPVATFGQFNGWVEIDTFTCYTPEWTWGAFGCAEGTFIADMVNREMYKISDSRLTPRAISEDRMICSNGDIYYL